MTATDTSIVVLIGVAILSVALLIAPLMIWYHVKRSANYLQTITAQLASLNKYLPSSEEAITLELREVAKIFKEAVE